MTEEAKRRAKELLTRRLDASRAATAAPATPAPAAPPPTKPASRDEVIRDLAASLKGAAQLTGGLDPAHRHVLDARRSLSEGNLAEAMRKLRLAQAMSPEDREIRAEHDRVALELAASLAANYAEQAQYEERHQKWAAAAVSWQKVVDGRPNEASCHWRCAKALLESSGDTKQAVRLAQRAVDLEPNNVFAIRTLGRAFMAAGMTLNAKRELERAVALDPRDEATKALLKELRG
jgi:Flp pilus assembly protein TadD